MSEHPKHCACRECRPDLYQSVPKGPLSKPLTGEDVFKPFDLEKFRTLHGDECPCDKCQSDVLKSFGHKSFVLGGLSEEDAMKCCEDLACYGTYVVRLGPTGPHHVPLKDYTVSITPVAPMTATEVLERQRERGPDLSPSLEPLIDNLTAYARGVEDTLKDRIGDGKKRKATPLATGVIDYFPDALLAVAELSRIGNDQHNPGQPLHWDRSKSGDESDALMRHFVDRGTIDVHDGVRHSAKVAWRALALLQKEIEKDRSRNSR